MEKGHLSRGSYATKRCPRCGAELYADMSVCYGCLYDFSRDAAGGSPGACCPDDTLDLSPVVPAGVGRGELGVYLRTASVDVWVPVSPDRGGTVGRDPANDVVLHGPAVSRRHLSLLPVPEGVQVTDLGATNPATYHGREVEGSVVVPYGDSVEVCGCVLTMTGDGPGGPSGGLPRISEKSL